MISVIVPFYNAEAWIDRCCASLAYNQPPFSVEFIMVDDKSTDGGAAIVTEWCKIDSRFILLENERSFGVSGARNTGIDAAEGEWVTFLDADDEMMPDAFRTMYSVIEADPRANIHQLNHMRYYTKIDKLALKYANSTGVYGYGRMPLCWYYVWNKIYRASFLEGIRFDEDLQHGEDSLFVLECLAKDNYIHHADRGKTAVKHRFDNKESLSRIKVAEDVRQQIRATEAFYDRQTNPVIKSNVCGFIADLWNETMRRLEKN